MRAVSKDLDVAFGTAHRHRAAALSALKFALRARGVDATALNELEPSSDRSVRLSCRHREESEHRLGRAATGQAPRH
jgi:hypothetical protein